MSPLKILFFAANPLNTPRLALGEEVRDIENKIRMSEGRDSVILKTRWAVQPDDLLQILNEEQPHVVHFSGHGKGMEGLCIHDGENGTSYVTNEMLSLLFEILKDNIKLVVLNACYSKWQAEVIAKRIDCVVGISSTITDRAARSFSASFYRAIGFGRSVANAFKQGVLAISLEGFPPEQESDIPVLMVRNGINADDVYLIEKGADIDIITEESDSLASHEVEEQLIDNTLPTENNEFSLLDRESGENFLIKFLPQIIEKRKLTSITIILADIDDLTVINKVYSKKVGDEALKTVAEIIHKSAQADGKCGRCGDDTFYIIMRHKVRSWTRGVQSSIQNHNWSTIAPDLRVTCSFGLATQMKDEPIDDTVVRAAIALNMAKSTDKNNIKWGPKYLPSKASRNLRHYFS